MDSETSERKEVDINKTTLALNVRTHRDLPGTTVNSKLTDMSLLKYLWNHKYPMTVMSQGTKLRKNCLFALNTDTYHCKECLAVESLNTVVTVIDVLVKPTSEDRAVLSKRRVKGKETCYS